MDILKLGKRTGMSWALERLVERAYLKGYKIVFTNDIRKEFPEQK